jgi:5-methylcytosine-specific restriction protein A
VPPSYRTLYKRLRDSEFGCVPPGFHETEDAYEMVRQEHPRLCDDNIQCQEVCGTDSTQAEWKHRIQTVQQDLVRYEESRVQNLSSGWFYGPHILQVQGVPEDPTKLEVGEAYNRWELNDVYGGGRYNGISTPADRALIFIFTSDSGETYGYEDGFQPDDTFLYTGEGTEGDMTMDGGNKSIRDHHANNEDLHLFEDTEHPWIVTYRGQYEYDSHQWEVLPDENENRRDAIRFLLTPIGGTEIELTGRVSTLSDEELYENAKRSSPEAGEPEPGASTTNSGQSYTRSEVVKQFALRMAGEICQGCDEEAPFVDSDGEPYLEVHHLHSRADGGADDPENVLAICPNCHRRVHYGRDGDRFNQELIETAAELYETLS